MNNKELAIFIDTAFFIPDSEKSIIKTLLHEVERLTHMDVNTALSNWGRITVSVSWYCSQAGMMVESTTKHKEERKNELLLEARRRGDPNWVGDAYGNIDPGYSRMMDQLVILRSWHDLMIKYYSICMAQKNILEQLSNNVRSGQRLDSMTQA